MADQSKMLDRNRLGRIGIVLAIVVAVGAAHADDKALKPYAGRVVISPDAPPTNVAELPAFLAANATKDNRYDLIKGPPWPFQLVAVLAKDPGAKPIQLVFADKADKKLTSIHAVELQSKRKLVIAKSEATISAGFVHDVAPVMPLVTFQLIWRPIGSSFLK